MNLGKYRLVAELGRGGMGIIHLAACAGRGGRERLVAVKELRPELAGDPEHRRMFVAEGRLGARLDHGNIVRVHEVACDAGRWFMVLELIEGCSFGRARKTLGSKLPLRLAVRVLCEVLAALDHAHERGIIHRDVSPENVLVGFDGRVKLLDFGVAKARDGEHVTRQGVVKGSMQYMSPDHVTGEPIDGRADVFAVGVLLREVLTGEKLWPADLDDLAIVRRLIAADVPPFPAHALRRAPQALREICSKATQADRARRFTSAHAMREALVAWLDAEDPRGSLAELGALLRRELPDDHARVRRMLEDERSAISLPASELETASTVALPLFARGQPRERRKRADRRLAIAALVLAGLAGIAAPALPLLDAEPLAKSPPAPAIVERLPTAIDREPRPAALRPPLDPLDPGY